VDLRFPRVADGLALIRAIREAGSTVCVIVQSGWPDDILGAPEERMVSRVLEKGSIRTLLSAIEQLAIV